MDRIDLTHEFGVDRQRAWRDRPTAASNLQRVVFGRLADGRWFADAGDREGAYVFNADERGEQLALRLAYRWMRESGRRWFATPAAYDNRSEPVDGLPWVRRGGEWFLED
jgi:hypothetical protein